MCKVIDFYYEFSSPYGYLAAMKVEEIASKHKVDIHWKPFLLGAVFKQVGTKPLLDYPVKGEYSLKDMYRTARFYNIPFEMPKSFPFMAVNACRLIIWAAGDDHEKRAELSKAIYKACYEDGRVISDKEVLLDIAEEYGYTRDEAEVGISSDQIKAKLKQEVEEGVKAQVFGSPFFVVDGEAFWGLDRLDHLDQWLETGGW
ncbi:2-hydroxychromene-2-carboxylate isomerase [Curvivirga aplysinae]|uniref:2-hydroxychromene-2-carboxylate isomerase n=1 Tax=Curvivirga aplysinae TaxID=2529852 RepID=UPI0012BB7708|nr:2-hydroxychromene-2-carboxylate isomerase [Curvivirga aplysinae]MTI09193.1 2-hydroxychromene-2-carboxylate isomerase [Curvivirga aplysinae]